jgi:hypothetical protein
MMDSHNLFLTRTTYRLLRLEYAAALVASIVLALAHVADVRWWAFVVLFAYIDVVGYLPGAVAWRRAHGGPIGRGYYVLYNSMHSLLSAGAMAVVWSVVFGAEWALLALPIHLCGDRSIFGNFLKPFGLSFEPRTHPAYEQFRSRYDQFTRQESNQQASALGRVR